MLPVSEFDRFQKRIACLPLKEEGERYERAQLICSEFLLFSDSGLDVYYIPFHHVNKIARVVLMGLTPGWTQMEEAFRAARQGTEEGLQDEELFRHIATTASFSGSMRKNLVGMLDGIGLNRELSICSCSELFGVHNEQVHLTSVVNMPIFKKHKNYSGHTPQLLQVPKLRQWLSDDLAAELDSVCRAVIIPLGRVADQAVNFLYKREHPLIDAERCLTGFPHPSGANGHRKTDFELGRDRWADQIAAWFKNHDQSAV
jgi:hypothetical protein